MAERARADERLALRWTPARNAIEQCDRDIAHAESLMLGRMHEFMYGNVGLVRMTGLDAALPTSAIWRNGT